MLCCILIALILAPLGLAGAVSVNAGGGGAAADCCRPNRWPLIVAAAAGAALLLACFLFWSPASARSATLAFRHLCVFGASLTRPKIF